MSDPTTPGQFGPFNQPPATPPPPGQPPYPSAPPPQSASPWGASYPPPGSVAAASYGGDPAQQQPYGIGAVPQQPYGSDPLQQPYAGEPVPAPYPADPSQPAPYPADQPYAAVPPAAPGWGDAMSAPPAAPTAAAPPSWQPPTSPMAQPMPPQMGATAPVAAGMTPPAAPPSGQKSRLPLIIAIVAAVAVVIAGVIFIPRIFGGDDPVPVDPGGAGGTTSAAGSGGASPVAVVEGYLNALAVGDAEAALAYGKTQPDDTTFLTSDFLKTVIETNPITEITVEDDPGAYSYASIEATYRLGSTLVSQTYTVSEIGDKWLLNTTYNSLELDKYQNMGVPVLLNGIDIAGKTDALLFPGVYSFTTTNTMLTLADASFTVESPGLYASGPYRLEADLSAEGVALIQAAAKTHLDGCLQAKSLAPPGCGFKISLSDGEPIPETIMWTVAADATDISTIVPEVQYNSLTKASASVSIGLNFTADAVGGGYYDTNAPMQFGFKPRISRVLADFTDPANIIVTFE